MLVIDKLNIPGEHLLSLPGIIGTLEAILTVPTQIHSTQLAILGHPHSLHGGTMNNKVVTTMVRAFKELGIPSLRFNFRGVGQSQGKYDAGIGESEDMLNLVQQWKKEQAKATFIFAGFSFGSYVAYRAAAQSEHSLLITIAPAVNHYDYKELQPAPDPWVIFQGDEDEIVPAPLVEHFAKECSPKLPIIHFSNTDHFFHGKLIELKSQLMDVIKTQVLSS